MAMKKQGKLPNVSKDSQKLLNALPTIISNEAKNHYLKGFKSGGGQTDDSSGGWQARKKKSKSKRGKRAILVKSGALRNDIDIRRVTRSEIVLGTLDTAYASYHNEGTKTLPQREFLGRSRVLDTKIDRLILRQVKKTYK